MNSDNEFHIFGHPVTLDAPEETAAWIKQRWPIPYARRGARPIHIRQGAIGWDEKLPAFDSAVYDIMTSGQLTPGGFVLRLGESLVKADLYGASAEITFSGEMQAVHSLLWVAVSEAIRLGGLLPFHASAFARDGRCVVLMAPSKTGKSTTLVSALLAGYQPVAEDILWIDPATLEVFGNDREIRLWADSLERFKRQLPAATQRPSDGKYAVPLEALPGYPPENCRLHRFVVLRRDLSQPSRLETVPELELVKTLWESGCVPIDRRGREQAQAGISELCRKVQYTGLLIGSTPLDFVPLFS
jgi:hypothetical protein